MIFRFCDRALAAVGITEYQGHFRTGSDFDASGRSDEGALN